ncbi:MAG TPA: F0F1 ATP synthase subunit alpha [Thermoanaerobaculia bacterium]|nr:F0F1 ATP synthase subunit alpha [Thermoanaerobaculia bacterium]
MKFKVDEISSVIAEEIKHYNAEADLSEVGTVLEVGDGIARVYGLKNAMASERVLFENGESGQVFNLEDSSVGIVILGEYLGIKEGDEVRRTGELLSIAVGDELVGRVVDPLGRALDGLGAIDTGRTRPLEFKAAGIAARQPVNEPLMTGIKAVDSMIPIGRGQRELIIGDRKTGKTAIAIDTIINQRGKGVICVYVAIGQKESTVASVIDKLRENGALDYTVVVVASASDPAPLQYIAPYAGAAIAEYFMISKGMATLCVYDDLSKQATAYRQLSLLLRRPPGREAYPGDVFYLHSRLLERSVKLRDEYAVVPADTPEDAIDRSLAVLHEQGLDAPVEMRADDEQGLFHRHEGRERAEAFAASLGDGYRVHRFPDSGGSMTALPIIETLEGEVSAYIPTNVISITDGQIYLEPDLFFAGVRPAINVGISVSRVGGNAQRKAMKKISGSLRLDLAAFRDLEAFAQLGTELDPASQRQLERGRRMTELLKQPQYRPYSFTDQVVSIYAGTRGFLDTVPPARVLEFERGLLTYFNDELPEVVEELDRTGALSEGLEEKIRAGIEEYRRRFFDERDVERSQPVPAPEEAPPVGGGADDAGALGADAEVAAGAGAGAGR